MQKNKLNSFYDGAIFSCILLLTLGCVGFNVHHIHIIHHQQHVRYLHSIKYKRHLKYVHKWLPLWNAKKYPSYNNLSKLRIDKPTHHVAIKLNNNHSTLNPKSWHYDHIQFSHKDSLGRLSHPATAYLNQTNVTGDALRKKQHIKPVGWHQHKYHGDYILNRGHLIAYSLSKDITLNGHYRCGRAVGNLNDKRNLFTETAFCNQQLQYAYETQVRIALEKGYHVIYQAQPVFYKHDLMARGIHLQAISTNKKLNFNVYLFNVQPGIHFIYKNGFEYPDSNMEFILPHKLLRRSQNMDENDKRMKLQRQIMNMYDTHQISYQQAYIDEQHVLGRFWVNDER